MSTINIENRRLVGGDFFVLIKTKLTRSGTYLKDFLPLFNFDDYYCFKATNVQRLVSEEEFLKFKHAGYTFFKKELYDLNHIMEWIEFSKSIGGLQYLVKPLPPFPPSKIIIRSN